MHARFRIVDGDNEFTGRCAQAGVDSYSSGTATVTKVANTDRRAKLIYKYAIIEGWEGAKANQDVTDVPGMSDLSFLSKSDIITFMNQYLWQTEAGWRSGNKANGYSDHTLDEISAWVDSRNVDSLELPDDFELYYCDAGGGQNFTMWGFVEHSAGALRLKKVSANTSITG